MKQFWKEAGLAVILGMIMPAVILHIVSIGSHHYAAKPKDTIIPAETTWLPFEISVQMEDGTVKEMEIDSYLTGVLLAEMPASFQVDALMAQAVVARTYALRCHEGKSKHESAAVCTDSRCCQGYCSREMYLSNGGSEADVKKAASAVRMTKELVLTYQGQLIDATYFSCSGGSTEDAVAVWGAEIPYLRATDSPGEEDAAYFTDTISYSTEEFSRLLNIKPSGNPDSWFSQAVYTAGGGVAEIDICGTTYAGTDLRKLLNLRSTAFTVTTSRDTITFHTRGYGHRVGMSQYGADAMAEAGSNFEDILYHYYQGTELQQYSIDKETSIS